MKNLTSRLATPLGALIFSCEGGSGNSQITITHCKPTVNLPPGMSVEHVDAFLLRCTAEERIKNLTFECHWEIPFAKGSPETGEALDAQSWSDGKSLVMIGTEDLDQLMQRLPDCGFSEENWPLFPDYGLKIIVPVIETQQSISLHFVVASNSLPEPKELSCWFAVDMKHEHLLNFCD